MDTTQRSPAHLATELEIRSAITDIRAALKNGPRHPNIWGFFSNKNRQLLTLVGDVTFIQAVLLEGDPRVLSYYVGAAPSTRDEHYPFGRDLVVRYRDEALHWYFCGRYENLIRAPRESVKKRIEETRRVAEEAAAEFYIKTERDFSERMIEFRNWLILCSAMTRSRDCLAQGETSELIRQLDGHKTVAIHSLLESQDCDPALMLSVIAKSIATGQTQCALKEKPINIDTEISQASLQRQPAPAPPRNEESNSNPVSTALVPRNRRTLQIPELWRDLKKWPHPEADLLVYPEAYRRNKSAVEMYVNNRDFKAIYEETGLKDAWVRKMFKKCLCAHSDGQICGFRGLVKYGKDTRRTYHRHLPPPLSNLHEGATDGYAGALIQLFEKFSDELLNIVEAEVLQLRTKQGAKIHEPRISWKNLQLGVLALLKSKGVKENEYPFNTRDRCYSSLAALGRSILFKKPIRFINSRFGKAAGALAHTGKGISSLVQPAGPFQIVELDFHKHDSAAIVDVVAPNGAFIPCNVPRWWIGCVVDTYNGAILGSSDSFEAQTSESCVLDLIESAVSAPCPSESLRVLKGCEDGRWLPNQILSAYDFHAWDVVRLDRALAHHATNTLSTLIATTGCAVCFSKPRAWWARSIVERTFNELTRRGAQRLPTTYGTGVGDDRRRNPEGTAIALHFTQDEMCDLAKAIIREINDTGREGRFWESALDSLRRTAEMPMYFPRPLPRDRHKDRPTEWVRCRVKVEASAKKGIPPSIRVHRCRYYGIELAGAWNLVKQFVFLEINRKDIRVARVINEQTGFVIGAVVPERKWRLHRVSWRNFLMIQKFGRYFSDATRPEDPVRNFKEKKAQEIDEAYSHGKMRGYKIAAQQLKNVTRDSDKNRNGESDPEVVSGENFQEIINLHEAEGKKSLPSAKIKLSPAPSVKSFSRGDK